MRILKDKKMYGKKLYYIVKFLKNITEKETDLLKIADNYNGLLFADYENGFFTIKIIQNEEKRKMERKFCEEMFGKQNGYSIRYKKSLKKNELVEIFRLIKNIGGSGTVIVKYEKGITAFYEGRYGYTYEELIDD